MKTILVTAKDGQLAQCIKSIAPKYPNYNFIFKSSLDLDITNSTQVNSVFNELKNIDYCVNCAAYTAVDKAETETENAFNVNVKGVKNLALACFKYQVKFIHISTDFVFNGKSEKAYTESDNTNPLNVYGTTKLKGEQEIAEILEKYFIIRTSWLYSEYGTNFLTAMQRLAKERDEIGVVSDQIGSPTYARDFAEVILHFIETETDAYGIYHYSNTGSISWYDFAKEIFKQSESKIKLNKITTKDYPTPAKRPQYSVLDTSKLQKTLNIDIPNWKDSLTKALLNLKRRTVLEIAVKAALHAGKEIMEVYDSKVDIEYKADNSPITEADKRANTIINSYLVKTKFPIISEENKQTDYSIRKTWDTCWIVDPLDGTKEFIKRNGEFTVNIALVQKGKSILGIIYVPVSKTLYYADVGQKEVYKTELNSHDTELSELFKRAVQLKKQNQTSKSIRVVSSRSHINPKALAYVESLKEHYEEVKVISVGSSLKFCLLAEGKADIYPRFSPTMEWDTAAGQAICNAVFINVVSQETKESLCYNKKNLCNSSFIVQNYDLLM